MCRSLSNEAVKTLKANNLKSEDDLKNQDENEEDLVCSISVEAFLYCLLLFLIVSAIPK